MSFLFRAKCIGMDEGQTITGSYIDYGDNTHCIISKEEPKTDMLTGIVMPLKHRDIDIKTLEIKFGGRWINYAEFEKLGEEKDSLDSFHSTVCGSSYEPVGRES